MFVRYVQRAAAQEKNEFVTLDLTVRLTLSMLQHCVQNVAEIAISQMRKLIDVMNRMRVIELDCAFHKNDIIFVETWSL